MKKGLVAMGLCALLILTGCANAEQMAASAPVPHTAASVEGTVFTFDGTDYEITERCPSVNALEIYDTIGEDTIIVGGHINPKVVYYGVFDTKTKTFEKDIQGGNLTFYGDDVNTIVYSLWGDILNYNGEALASYDLQEPEFISHLSYWEDGTALNVTICGADGETERTESLVLSQK